MSPSQNPAFLEQFGPREAMEYDVVIVGAGPAGLSAAIRLKQLAEKKGQEISVCVLEKGSEPGAHILSGAVMDPRAMNELFPDWKARGAPLNTPVTEDRFLFLTETGATSTPNWLLPGCFKNHGNYVISLGNVVRWLAQQAEAMGVEIFPGFAAADILFDDHGAVAGVATGNMGVGKDGEPGSEFQLGMELRAKYTFFAEGARGHLGKQLISHYQLDAGRDPQTYAIGIKELWEVDPAKHQPGLVMHTAGWPLDSDTYGGSFLYHLENNQVVVGYVVGLAYQNPWLSPFEEFQRYKTHPSIRGFFEGGKRLSYGARAITAGGLQSLPKFTFPGGALVGCDAGFLNASRIKGSHAAMKTGMLAAEAAFDAIAGGREQDELHAYTSAFEQSWLHEELHVARNFKPAMSKGLYTGTLLVGIDQVLFRGKAPWTLHHSHADHECLRPASEFEPIVYPKPDGKLSFDRLSSVFISNTNHNEHQPAHLTLKNPAVPVTVNLATYAGPESRYCPAGVYEYVSDSGSERLQINAQNCVHCKTCDIKDPTQNIVWVTPEGGGGPNYPNM
jgi:electron-transferring-flavoprotein dehydrogenase